MLALLQMVEALRLLLNTECSPLEDSVEYNVPDSWVVALLLTQLEGLQDLWAEVDRSALTPVTVWIMIISLQPTSSLCCARCQETHALLQLLHQD